MTIQLKQKDLEMKRIKRGNYIRWCSKILESRIFIYIYIYYYDNVVKRYISQPI